MKNYSRDLLTLTEYELQMENDGSNLRFIFYMKLRDEARALVNAGSKPIIVLRLFAWDGLKARVFIKEIRKEIDVKEPTESYSFYEVACLLEDDEKN